MTVSDMMSVCESLKNEINNLEEASGEFKRRLSKAKETYYPHFDIPISANDENIKYILDVLNITDSDGFTVNMLISRAESQLHYQHLYLCNKRKAYNNFLNQDFNMGGNNHE